MDSDTDDANIAAQLSSLSASIVSDAALGEGVVAPGLRRFSGVGTAAGRAVTADCAEGSLAAVFGALDHAHAGDFLCVKAPGSSAYLGDLLAAEIASRGLAGAVVDGLIRDSAELAGMTISIFARGVSPLARRRQEAGRDMVAIDVGGVSVEPGDWIVGDADGIVVIPAAKVLQVLQQAEENARIEDRIMARVRAGEKLLDAVRAEVPRPD